MSIFRQSSVALALMAGMAVIGHEAFAQDASSSQSAALEGATAKQKISFTNEVVSEMQDGLKDVGRMLDTANKGGDPEQIQCVKDKLASMQALKQVTELAEGALTEALAANAEERANHELRKIGVAASKFRQFYAEAAACIGEASVGGTTDVEVNKQALTEDDDTEDQVGDIEIEGDPPDLTPFE